MYTHTRVHIHEYAYIFTDTHIYIYIHMHMHTYIHAHMHSHKHIYVHAHLYTDRTSQRQHLDVSNNIIDTHTHPYTYACIYTYTCIYTYVHNMQWMCWRCVRWCHRNICITHTGAHALVPRTPVLKCSQHPLQKKVYIYIYIHTYAYECICTRIHMRIYDTAQTRWRMATETQNLWTNMYTHTYTHVYTCMRIPIHIHIQIYTCLHVHKHIYIHTYTHTHTTCTCARMQARLERQRCSDCARSWCRRRKLCTSFSFDAINHISAPPMLGLYCTHFLRHQYHSTPHPLFPIYPRTVRGPQQARPCGAAEPQ